MIKSTRHKLYFLVFIAIVLVVLCLVAMHIGAVKFSVAEGFRLLFSPDDSNESFVLHHTRIPRIIAALIIGGALSLSGALYQGVIGNPLVSPGIAGRVLGRSWLWCLALICLALSFFALFLGLWLCSLRCFCPLSLIKTKRF